MAKMLQCIAATTTCLCRRGLTPQGGVRYRRGRISHTMSALPLRRNGGSLDRSVTWPVASGIRPHDPVAHSSYQALTCLP
jgi:hypothetical protein